MDVLTCYQNLLPAVRTSRAARPTPRTVAKVQPAADVMPPAAWMDAAAGFLADCQRGLESSPDAMRALAARCLTPDTARACGIGWNSADCYPLRAAWGLDAGQGGRGKLVLPAGLVIAAVRPQGVASLTIRTVDPSRPRYHEVAGGARGAAYVLGERGRPVALLESALDAALLIQETEERFSAVATMGSSKPMDADAVAFIKAAPAVIAVPDNDDGGRAAWARWHQLFSSAVCLPVVGGKDLGDAHRAALAGEEGAATIEEWAAAVQTLLCCTGCNRTSPENLALTPSLQMET